MRIRSWFFRGNYERFDHKGWEISLQAFARYKQVPDSHLYIHSVSKNTMEFNRQAGAVAASR